MHTVCYNFFYIHTPIRLTEKKRNDLHIFSYMYYSTNSPEAKQLTPNLSFQFWCYLTDSAMSKTSSRYFKACRPRNCALHMNSSGQEIHVLRKLAKSYSLRRYGVYVLQIYNRMLEREVSERECPAFAPFGVQSELSRESVRFYR